MPSTTSLITEPAAHALSVLPATPCLEALRTAVAARLDVLTHQLLPALRAERAFLTTVWYSRADDACVLHVGAAEPGSMVPCDPAGADRLATLLATEDALTRERTALRDLTAALDDYRDGGRELRALGAGTARESTTRAPEACELRERPGVDDGGMVLPPILPNPGSIAGRMYVGQLCRYVAIVDRALADATARGDAADVAGYARERAGVRDRLSACIARLAPLDRDGGRPRMQRARARRPAIRRRA